MKALGLWVLLATRVFAQGGRAKDTAGSRLRAVWTKARQSCSDALLISITGKTGASGAALCDPASPFQDGWRFTFYSPKRKEHLMMAECGGAIAGPLVPLVAREKGFSRLDIQGRFIDSDAALEMLAKGGVALDPAKHKGGGKRPYTLALQRIEDEHHPTHPLVWTINVGEDSYRINAGSTESSKPDNISR